ncbi:MAG: hypothetical protein JSR26_12710 [Proteobacteria bacterium]|nr:hypothetical protein [Pseudomonadota bacterium]
MATPGPFGNVFIVAGDGASHRVAWNIARQPAVPGPMGPIIAAWQAGNAREQAATERSGPIAGPVGVLPADAQGRSRFYIDGIRAQAAGATVGAQTTVWVWDGKAAQPLLAHAYGMMLDQSVGTRFEQGLLKLREKRDYRAFFSCGACEGRQVDWSVRVDAKGVSEQGVRSVAPELDVLDELLWRRIHGRAANDIAAPAAVAQVDALVRKAKAEVSAADWKQFPSFGMANALDVRKSASGARACVDTDAAGAFTADLQRRGEGWFITRIAVAPKGCSASGA